MIPGIAIQIPQYIMYSRMGIRDTYWIWVIMGMAGNAYLVFLFRQYFSSIPKEIEEAAIIDGCSTFRMLTKIFIPIAKPVIFVAMVLNIQWSWNDYSTPFMYLNEDKFTLALGMIFKGYTIPSSPDIPLMPLRSCGAILLSIPVLLVFFLAQRQLAEGIVTGAVKG
jgi:ABC-type glycerol-3-phosphate transport system permease component